MGLVRARRSAAAPADTERGGALARAARRGVEPLPERSAELALQYLERIARTAPAMTPELGVLLTSLGYGALRAVEADGSPWGVTEVQVLSLPDQPPRDLLLRVVKACRRPFRLLRAVDEPTWEGFVGAVAGREGKALGRALVDGLLRFGWVLRQVDLHYEGSAAELGQEGVDDRDSPG